MAISTEYDPVTNSWWGIPEGGTVPVEFKTPPVNEPLPVVSAPPGTTSGAPPVVPSAPLPIVAPKAGPEAVASIMPALAPISVFTIPEGATPSDIKLASGGPASYKKDGTDYYVPGSTMWQMGYKTSDEYYNPKLVDIGGEMRWVGGLGVMERGDQPLDLPGGWVQQGHIAPHVAVGGKHIPVQTAVAVSKLSEGGQAKVYEELGIIDTASIKRDAPELYDVLMAQGIEAYNNALRIQYGKQQEASTAGKKNYEQQQLEYEAQIRAFEEGLPGLPKYLQDAYVFGGIAGYNDAVADYNKTLDIAHAVFPPKGEHTMISAEMGTLGRSPEFTEKYATILQPGGLDDAEYTKIKPFVKPWGFDLDGALAAKIPIKTIEKVAGEGVIKPLELYARYLDEGVVPRGGGLVMGIGLTGAEVGSLGRALDQLDVKPVGGSYVAAWCNLDDEAKYQAAALVMHDPYKGNAFASVVRDVEYLKSQLPALAQYSILGGELALAFIAPPIGMTIMATEATAPTIARATVGEKVSALEVASDAAMVVLAALTHVPPAVLATAKPAVVATNVGALGIFSTNVAVNWNEMSSVDKYLNVGLLLIPAIGLSRSLARSTHGKSAASDPVKLAEQQITILNKVIQTSKDFISQEIIKDPIVAVEAVKAYDIMKVRVEEYSTTSLELRQIQKAITDIGLARSKGELAVLESLETKEQVLASKLRGLRSPLEKSISNFNGIVLEDVKVSDPSVLKEINEMPEKVRTDLDAITNQIVTPRTAIEIAKDIADVASQIAMVEGYAKDVTRLSLEQAKAYSSLVMDLNLQLVSLNKEARLRYLATGEEAKTVEGGDLILETKSLQQRLIGARNTLEDFRKYSLEYETYRTGELAGEAGVVTVERDIFEALSEVYDRMTKTYYGEGKPFGQARYTRVIMSLNESLDSIVASLTGLRTLKDETIDAGAVIRDIETSLKSSGAKDTTISAAKAAAETIMDGAETKSVEQVRKGAEDLSSSVADDAALSPAIRQMILDGGQYIKTNASGLLSSFELGTVPPARKREPRLQVKTVPGVAKVSRRATADEMKQVIQTLSDVNMNRQSSEIDKFVGDVDIDSGAFDVKGKEHGGWKLHIYGTSPDDVASIMEAVYPLLKENDIRFKVARQERLGRVKEGQWRPWGVSAGDQYAKAVTIYVPKGVDPKEVLGQLRELLRAYTPSSGEGRFINDENVARNIGLRYELGEAGQYVAAGKQPAIPAWAIRDWEGVSISTTDILRGKTLDLVSTSTEGLRTARTWSEAQAQLKNLQEGLKSVEKENTTLSDGLSRINWEKSDVSIESKAGEPISWEQAIEDEIVQNRLQRLIDRMPGARRENLSRALQKTGEERVEALREFQAYLEEVYGRKALEDYLKTGEWEGGVPEGLESSVKGSEEAMKIIDELKKQAELDAEVKDALGEVDRILREGKDRSSNTPFRPEPSKPPTEGEKGPRVAVKERVEVRPEVTTLKTEELAKEKAAIERLKEAETERRTAEKVARAREEIAKEEVATKAKESVFPGITTVKITTHTGQTSVEPAEHIGAMTPEQAQRLYGNEMLVDAISAQRIPGAGVGLVAAEAPKEARWLSPSDAIKEAQQIATQQQAQTAIQQQAQTAIQQQAQSIIQQALQLQNQGATRTQLQNVVQQAIQQQASTTLRQQFQVELQRQLQHQTELRQLLQLETILKPLKPLKPPPPPVIPLTPTEAVRWGLDLPLGTITWKQGMFYKSIPPPYKILKPITTRYPIAGYKASGRTPQETIQVVGGARIPHDISIDLGVVDIFIEAGTDKPIISFAGGGVKTDVGKRIFGPIAGISIPGAGTPRAPSVRYKVGVTRKTSRRARPQRPIDDFLFGVHMDEIG